MKYMRYRNQQYFRYYGTNVHFPKDSVLFERVCREGIYERSTVNLISALVEPGTCYFDIGGNIGLMAAPILHNCPAAQVVSFEPSPNSYPFLKRTRDGSPHRSRWKVLERACGTQEGELEFHVAAAGQGAFDGFRNTGRVPIKKKIRVPVTTLDKEWERLGRPRVSVVKVDVEGAEMQVLGGARHLLEDERPALVVEWTDLNLESYGARAEEILTFAEEAGYSLYSTKPMLPLTNSRMLRLQMRTNDMFLLMPQDRPAISEDASMDDIPHKVVEL
jgi:FkbM family methyltransferase